MKILIWLFISLNFINRLGMGQDYSVLDVKELSEMVWANKGVLKKQLAFNQAFVYKLKDKRIILIPNTGSPGILFNDKAILNKMIKEQRFSVPENYENPLIRDREKIKDLEANIIYYVKDLENSLKIKLSNESDSLFINEKILEVISDRLNQIDNTEMDSFILNNIIPLTLFIGEYVKTKTNTSWKLSKQFTLNPFWSFDLWRNDINRNSGLMSKLDNALLSSKPIDLNKIVDKKIVALNK